MKNSIYLRLILCVIFIKFTYAQNNFWKPTNGPYGTIVNDVGISPDSVIYLATEGRGLLKSDDKGDSWNKINDDTGLYSVHSIAFGDSGKIFISGITNEFAYGSIYVSDDGGMTWENTQLPPGTLLNYSGDTLFLAAKNSGIFQTFDNGHNWVSIGNSDSIPSNVYDIIRDINGNLYTASYDIIIGKKSSVFSSNYSKGVYKSVDLGLTWDNINDNIDVSQICVNNSGTIIANGFYPHVSDDIYRSTDYGENWETITGLPPTKMLMFFNDIDLFAAAQNGIYKSESYGNTWQKINNTNHDRINVIKKTGESILLAGSNYGILKSVDSGDTWAEIMKGFPAIQTYALLSVDSRIICGGKTSGIFRSNNNGDTWQSFGGNFDSNYDNIEIYALLSNSEGRIFAATSSLETLYYSDDYGDSWQSSHFYKDYAEIGVKCMALDDSNYVYLGTNDGGVYISRNNGNDITYSGVSNKFISSLYSDRENNIIYAGTYYSDKVYYSLNKGKSWMAGGSGLPQSPVQAISAFNNIVYAGTEHGLYVSYDSAGTWQQFNSDLSETNILSICCTKDDNIYIGTRGEGVMVSFDQGAHFNTLSEGLSGDSVYNIIENDNHYLIAANEKGVNVSASPITTIKESGENYIKEFALRQNYPNPFNPKTVINYYLPKSVYIKLTIYDILGREVDVLVNKEQIAGYYKVKWNAAEFASGIYIYSLKTKSKILNRKMVLLK